MPQVLEDSDEDEDTDRISEPLFNEIDAESREKVTAPDTETFNFDEPNHKKNTEVAARVQYKCPQCKYQTCEKALIELHVRRHRTSCPFENKKGVVFTNHLAKIHGDATFTLYECDKCDYSSCRKSHLMQHKLDHAWKAKGNFVCQVCNYAGQSEKAVEEHFNKKHTINEPFKCPQCPYVSACMGHVQKHIRVHEEGRFDCKDCSFKSKTRQELLKHQIELHHYEAPFKCPHCSYVSHSIQLLKLHKKVHKKGRLDCEKCPFRGNTQQELMKHQVDLHGYQPPFRCSHCLYVSHCRVLLKTHMKVHKKGRFDCEKCSFKGKTQQELVKHQVELHDYQPLFKCSHCSYVSDALVTFRSHIKVHAKGRFDCEKCPFKGISRQELVKHQVENHGYQLPFKCAHCSYVSDRLTTFRSHTKVHMEGRFDCEKCSFKGSTRQELVKHQVENHGYQLPFNCSKCEFRTYMKNLVRMHEKRVH